MEDSKIVELYFDRDETAIEETKNKYDNYCFSISYNILYNRFDAEECVNDTYAETWNAIPPHKPNNLKTFIGKITRHLSLNVYRSKTANKRGGTEFELSLEELGDCIADEKSVSNDISNSALTEIINEFLSTLKEDERKVFVCRYYYFDSVNDIANRFDFTISKVKMMLKRTRDKLKDYLEKEGVVL